MRSIDEKILTFEYIVYKLIDWYNQVNGIDNLKDFNEKNDFSILKLMKLHFFVCAVNSDGDDNLLGIFDKFYAMPLGHVESEIYSHMDEVKRYDISVNPLKIKSSFMNNLDSSFNNLSVVIRSSVDESITKLKATNVELVNYKAPILVELSHNWYSWKAMYNFARRMNKYSAFIDPVMIKNENKFFVA